MLNAVKNNKITVIHVSEPTKKKANKQWIQFLTVQFSFLKIFFFRRNVAGKLVRNLT